MIYFIPGGQEGRAQGSSATFEYLFDALEFIMYHIEFNIIPQTWASEWLLYLASHQSHLGCLLKIQILGEGYNPVIKCFTSRHAPGPWFNPQHCNNKKPRSVHFQHILLSRIRKN
jgi:hypothetical protein